MSLEQVNVDGNWVEVKLFFWHVSRLFRNVPIVNYLEVSPFCG